MISSVLLHMVLHVKWKIEIHSEETLTRGKVDTKLAEYKYLGPIRLQISTRTKGTLTICVEEIGVCVCGIQ